MQWLFITTAAAPIATRVNLVAPGASAIVPLCPFETVTKERLSPFCPMFSEEDFEIYEYTVSIEKFYNRRYAQHPSITADTYGDIADRAPR